MTVQPILLLGDQRLYHPSEPVVKLQQDLAGTVINDLKDTIGDFKKRFGFGRAIAAPQINAHQRIIYLKTDDLDIGFINPALTFPNEEQFEVWDDCMSFPGLEIRLYRYKTVQVTWQDIDFKEHTILFDGDMAELIQHEYDHLDGILAVQRAIDPHSFRFNREKAQCF